MGGYRENWITHTYGRGINEIRAYMSTCKLAESKIYIYIVIIRYLRIYVSLPKIVSHYVQKLEFTFHGFQKTPLQST